MTCCRQICIIRQAFSILFACIVIRRQLLNSMNGCGSLYLTDTLRRGVLDRISLLRSHLCGLLFFCSISVNGYIAFQSIIHICVYGPYTIQLFTYYSVVADIFNWYPASCFERKRPRVSSKIKKYLIISTYYYYSLYYHILIRRYYLLTTTYVSHH